MRGTLHAQMQGPVIAKPDSAIPQGRPTWHSMAMGEQPR